jgi:uncharacterized protein (DUF952 family)
MPHSRKESHVRHIYHLVLRSAWELESTAPYRAASLAIEGFIHCSNANQVAGAANRFYANATDLFILHIDPAQLTSPLRYEAAANGELFPHIYGPIDRAAILKVEPMQRGPDGVWTFRS